MTLATHLGCIWEEKLLLKSLSVGHCDRYQGNFLRRLGGLSRRVCSAPQAWFPCPLPSCFMGYNWAMPRSRLRVAKVTELEAALPTAVLRPRRALLVILTDSCRPTHDPSVSGVRMKTGRPSQWAPHGSNWCAEKLASRQMGCRAVVKKSGSQVQGSTCPQLACLQEGGNVESLADSQAPIQVMAPV